MSNTFTLGPTPNTVRATDGRVLTSPECWVLLPPGDPALTRRVKAAGDHWAVAEKKGRKVFSRGVWAPAATIERIRAELDAERSTESFANKKEADARRRENAQAEYVEDFLGAVVTFLGFHPNYADLADRLARAVTDHATPVGSGTVARTKRIPVEQRAEAAVIAWMRHTTTGYDGMVIPRVKGKRREVRRMLARRSHELLERYRRGEPVGEECPLKKALAGDSGGQQKEVAVREVNNDKERKHGDQPNHGDHKHAFADPAERAKKWNDPERDKWQHPEEIVAALALKPGATVADIGAGTGYMVAHLSKAVGKGGTVIAIDASAAMVEYLTKRSVDLGPAKIVPRKVGPDDLELQTSSVDGVLTLDAWHHVKGQEAYAKKVYEGLRRGGKFVVVEHEVDGEIGPPKAMRLEPASVTKQLESAGFRVEVVRESMPRHYMVVGHKD